MGHLPGRSARVVATCLGLLACGGSAGGRTDAMRDVVTMSDHAGYGVDLDP